jgi:hypothetical protein
VRRPAVAVAALQVALFVTLGLPDGGLGVAWPSMRGAVSRPLGALGLVLAVGTIGYVLGSPSVSTVARRYGTPRTMMVGSAVAAAALTGWSATRSWPLLLMASFVLGIARGVIDAGLNAYVALHGGVRRLGLLHGAYGLGTSVGSLLVVASLATGSWRPAWVVMAALDAAVAVWAARRRDDWPPDVVVEPPAADGPDAALNRGGLVIAVTVLCFAALVGAEYSTGAWSYTLLTDGRGLGDTAAGLWVAAYWGGLTVARFAVGVFGNRIGRVTLLHLSCAVALTGVGLLWWDPVGRGAIGLPTAASLAALRSAATKAGRRVRRSRVSFRNALNQGLRVRRGQRLTSSSPPCHASSARRKGLPPCCGCSEGRSSGARVARIIRPCRETISRDTQIFGGSVRTPARSHTTSASV